MSLIWKSGQTHTDLRTMVLAGREICNYRVYVARAKIENALLIGKYVDGRGPGAYITYRGVEHRLADYEVLTNPGNAVDLFWRASFRIDGDDNPVFDGGQLGCLGLLIGRAKHEGKYTVVGYIEFKHIDGTLWYSWDGYEYSTTQFEVLCYGRG